VLPTFTVDPDAGDCVPEITKLLFSAVAPVGCAVAELLKLAFEIAVFA
jgi:hypothetical protein